MVNKYYLAIDIGASSGRHIVGWLENNEIKTDEVYRFKNGTKTQNGHLVWDIKNLFDNVIKVIRDALKKYDGLCSVCGRGAVCRRAGAFNGVRGAERCRRTKKRS